MTVVDLIYHDFFTVLLVLFMLNLILFIVSMALAAGFYICWGCLVWVPSIYTSPGMYLVNHPVNLGIQVWPISWTLKKTFVGYLLLEFGFNLCFSFDKMFAFSNCKHVMFAKVKKLTFLALYILSVCDVVRVINVGW